jgi:hypothetical protein
VKQHPSKLTSSHVADVKMSARSTYSILTTRDTPELSTPFKGSRSFCGSMLTDPIPTTVANSPIRKVSRNDPLIITEFDVDPTRT